MQQWWSPYPSLYGNYEATAVLAIYPSFCVNYSGTVAVMSPFLSMVIMIHMKQQLHLPCVLVSVLIIQQQWLLYPSFHGNHEPTVALPDILVSVLIISQWWLLYPSFYGNYEATAALTMCPSFCVNYFTVVAVISQFLW